jgi:hypothetical protein
MKLNLVRNAAFIFLLSLSGRAVQKATLLVSVTDPSGAPLAGSHVVLRVNSNTIRRELSP